MDFKAMAVGDVREFPGTEWSGANQALFQQMQDYTVETIGAVLFQVDTERDQKTARVIRYTVTRTQ